MSRRDAIRATDVLGTEQLSIDLKPHRCVSDVYINQKLDVTELDKFLKEKKKENPNVTYFHLFMTALGKVIYNRPKINRFVANRHIWIHKKVVIAFVAKVKFEDQAEELMVQIPFEENDTLDTISKKIYDKVHRVRGDNAPKGGANNVVDMLGHLPNIIRVPIVGVLKWMDDKGMLPASIQEDNIYYSSMIVSNLGTLHSPSILHNINDFGTSSVFVTMGEIKDEEVLINGKKEIRKIVDFGINLDERIADGFYFIKCVKVIQEIFNHPELLEDKVSEKVEIEGA